MTPTTEQLKDILAKVTQGDWYIDGGQLTSGTLHEMDCIVDHVYGTEANATLIALAPTLAAEVVRLREALADVVRYIPDSVVECRGDKCRELWCASCFGFDAAEVYMETVEVHRKAAHQALDDTSAK